MTYGGRCDIYYAMGQNFLCKSLQWASLVAAAVAAYFIMNERLQDQLANGAVLEVIEAGGLLVAGFVVLVSFVLILKSFVIDEDPGSKPVNMQFVALRAYLATLLLSCVESMVRWPVNMQFVALRAYLATLLLSCVESMVRWVTSLILGSPVTLGLSRVTLLASHSAPPKIIPFSWPQGHPQVLYN